MKTNKALATALRLDSNRLEIARLRAERDALADALRNLLVWDDGNLPGDLIDEARAALDTLNREGAAL